MGFASLVGGGIQALGATASAAMKERERNRINKQMTENEDWFRRRSNENYTQRADAVNALNRSNELIIARNNDAIAAQAVGGLSSESAAQTKAQNAAAMGSATSNIALAGASHKDAVESNYMAKKDAYNQQLNQLDDQQAQNVAQVGESIGSSLAGSNLF